MGSPEQKRFVGNPFYPGQGVVAMDYRRLPLRCWLQCSAMIVVEGFVQQENLVGLHAQDVELAADLLEGVRSKPAPHQGADVFGAEIDLDGAARMQGERDVTHGA